MKAVANYKRVIFIATGIGATPFSSILKDLHLGPDEVGETDRYLDPEWREKVLGLQDELKTYFFWMNYSEGGFNGSLDSSTKLSLGMKKNNLRDIRI